MKRNFIWIILIFTLLLAGLYYYNSKKKGQEDDLIKIGAILPLSGGSSSDAGNQIKDALELYKEEYNLLNVKKVEIIYGDSKNSASDGISAYRQIKANGVKYFIASNSGVVMPLTNEFKRDTGNLLMTTVNSAAGVPESGENIFRIFVSIQNETKTMANYIKDNLELKSIAVLYINDEFGKSGLENFEKYNSIDILYRESFDKNSIDFKNIVNKIPRKAEAVYIIGYDNALGLIIKQLREAGFKNKILTTFGMSIPPWRAKAGNAAEGVIYTGSSFDSNSSDTLVVNFIKKFKAKFNKEVTSINVFSYYSMKIFLDAINNCHTESTKCVINRINNSSNESIMGKINIDENGEADLPLSLYTYINGREEFLRQ